MFNFFDLKTIIFDIEMSKNDMLFNADQFSNIETPIINNSSSVSKKHDGFDYVTPIINATNNTVTIKEGKLNFLIFLFNNSQNIKNLIKNINVITYL